MAQQQQVPEMQLAQILSDLVSLSAGVCPPAAALALVSVRSSSVTATDSDTAAPTTSTTAQQEENDKDPDLRRANELVHLHYTVRERCKTGDLGRGLAEARRAVEGAMGG